MGTFSEPKHSISAKRSFRPSSSIRHAVEWPISDVSSDITIEIGEKKFSLHKFPVVSRSGVIRRKVLETKEGKVSRISLPSVPGGAEAFELAAKFCYGVHIDITLSNVAALRCLSHYLEMTDEFAEKNLESRTETYMKDKVLPDMRNSISVLHSCEALLPIAEEINVVSRIINGIACNASKEQLVSGLSKLEQFSVITSTPILETPSDWWGKSLAVLNLDFFQRVISALRTKGLKQDMITKILINYAQNSLHGLVHREPVMAKGSFADAETRKKQKVAIEAIIDLLPTQSRKCSVPISFLSGLLKTAITMSASNACDLEKRIGLQLDNAIDGDILIPSNLHSNNNNNSLYDTDVVLRIFTIFLNSEEESDGENHMTTENELAYDFDIHVNPKQSPILKVSKLLDNFLAEIALDSNLMPSKFISLAELLPDHARLVEDGLYRAIDIYLKAHPNIKDSDRYQLCKTIDCQKLSQEARSHAAQNERLPMQMAVQVLYIEQMKLRNAMNGGHNHFFGSTHGEFPQRLNSAGGSGAISPRDNYASVRRENRELKLEVARMRMRLTELEKDHVSIKQELVRSNPTNNLLKSFTKKLRKLNALFHLKDKKPIGATSDPWFLFQKQRRRSIS